MSQLLAETASDDLQRDNKELRDLLDQKTAELEKEQRLHSLLKSEVATHKSECRSKIEQIRFEKLQKEKVTSEAAAREKELKLVKSHNRELNKLKSENKNIKLELDTFKQSSSASNSANDDNLHWNWKQKAAIDKRIDLLRSAAQDPELDLADNSTELNRNAADLAEYANNINRDVHILDLHQLEKHEAIDIFKQRFMLLQNLGETKNVMEVITGKGINSDDGEPKIKPHLMDYLRAQQPRIHWRVKPKNAGRLVVTVPAIDLKRIELREWIDPEEDEPTQYDDESD